MRIFYLLLLFVLLGVVYSVRPKATRRPSSLAPSSPPSKTPTNLPTISPTFNPTSYPSKRPTVTTESPSRHPTLSPIPTSMPSNAPIAGTKQNVLLIISDDLKPLLSSYNLPYSGNTVNIDRIASRGVRFMNAHCQFSLCGPSRASMLTGVRPDVLGIFTVQPNQLVQRLRKPGPKIVTLPELFKSQGYQTYGIGKIFQENEYSLYTSSALWTEPVYTWMNRNGMFSSFSRPYVGSWIDFPEVNDLFFSDGQAADLAAKLITDKLSQTPIPWFLVVGFWKPHLPWHSPARYLDESIDEEPPVSGNPLIEGISPYWLSLTKGQGCDEVLLYTKISSSLSGKSPIPTQKNGVRAYRATIAYLDAQIGRILDALDSSSSANNTHIILVGDHGFHLGDKGLYCKKTNFEQAVRVPFMIAPAWENTIWDLSRGQKSYAPVELLDLVPTVMDLTLGKTILTPTMRAWQGTSLAPILNDPINGFVKAMSVSQYPRTTGSSRRVGYTVRTTRYRLTVWCGTPINIALLNNCYRELYDFVDDPHESKNLATSQTAVAQKMMDNALYKFKFDDGIGVKPWDFDERVAVESLPKQPFP